VIEPIVSVPMEKATERASPSPMPSRRSSRSILREIPWIAGLAPYQMSL